MLVAGGMQCMQSSGAAAWNLTVGGVTAHSVAVVKLGVTVSDMTDIKMNEFVGTSSQLDNCV